MLNSIRKLWNPDPVSAAPHQPRSGVEGEAPRALPVEGATRAPSKVSAGDELKTLVTVMAKSLVDNPDAVDVTLVDKEQTTVVELRVAKEDLGKVIGKEGRTARSLRTILSAASTKIRKRAVLEIIE